MERHPTTTDTLAEDIQDVLVESKMLMGELYNAKIQLIKNIIGEEAFQRAEDFIATQTTPESFVEDEDMREQLQALDNAQWREKARDVLNLDPQTDEEKYHRVWADMILHQIFPDQTVLTILEDEEKLTELGMRLKKMIDEDSMYENEYVSAYGDAYWKVDSIITRLYIQATGQDGIEHIEVDDMGFNIQLHDSFFSQEHDAVMNDGDRDLPQKPSLIAQMSQASVYVSVVSEELRLDNQPVINRIQLEEIRAVLQPIPRILEDLSLEPAT